MQGAWRIAASVAGNGFPALHASRIDAGQHVGATAISRITNAKVFNFYENR